MTLPSPVIGCNFAYKDWRLDYCVAVDRMCVHEIRKHPHPDINWITKKTSLELPQGWQSFPAPGVDSGTLAIELATTLGDQVLVIGADGILNGSAKTRYHYRWHPNGPKPGRHARFRKTAIELNIKYPEKIKFVYDGIDQELETVSTGEVLTRLNK